MGSRRPGVKGVLLSLADDCKDINSRGCFCAFTSVSTMAQEAEASTRTVDAHLSVLRGLGLISEFAPPGQHRPRTWRLEISEIAELVPDEQLSRVLRQKGHEELARFISRRSDASPVANHGTADRQRAATLNRADAADPQTAKPDPQFSDADSQLANPESQNSRSGSQLVAPNGTTVLRTVF